MRPPLQGRRRFKAVEQRVKASGREMGKLSLEELDAEWDAVKREAHA